jgi:hypothetical protein
MAMKSVIYSEMNELENVHQDVEVKYDEKLLLLKCGKVEN